MGIPVPILIGFFYDRDSRRTLNKNLNINVFASFVALFAIFYLSIKNIELKQSSNRLSSLDDSLEVIVERFDEGDNLFVFNETRKLLETFSKNKLLKLYYEKSSYPIDITSRSLPADVFIKYGEDTIWHSLGETPIEGMRVPWFMGRNDYQLKFNFKHGFISS